MPKRFGVDAAAIPEPRFQNLSLTKEWLEEAVLSDPVKSRWKDELEGLGKEEALGLRSLILSSSKESYQHFSVSNEQTTTPSVKVVVIYDDGSAISTSSESNRVFMLPWRLENGAAPVKTFNANISRAVADLMEHGATNRERLQGSGLGIDLADAVWMGITSRNHY